MLSCTGWPQPLAKMVLMRKIEMGEVKRSERRPCASIYADVMYRMVYCARCGLEGWLLGETSRAWRL